LYKENHASNAWFSLYKKHRSKERCLFVAVRVSGETEEVVHRNTIKLREADQDISRDIPLTELIIAVDLLRTV